MKEPSFPGDTEPGDIQDTLAISGPKQATKGDWWTGNRALTTIGRRSIKNFG